MTSKCCSSAAQVVTGALVTLGVAAVVWVLLGRRAGSRLDPQIEIDRRIDELENSLTHLQDAFGHAIGG